MMSIGVVTGQVFAVKPQTAIWGLAGTRHAQGHAVTLQMAYGYLKIIAATHIHVKWVRTIS